MGFQAEISETILDEIIYLTNDEKSVGPKDIGILIELFTNADFFTSITVRVKLKISIF